MKTGTVILVVIAGVALILYHQWYTSGAAQNCSFIDTLLHKCGAS